MLFISNLRKITASFLYNICRTFNVYLSIVINEWFVFPFIVYRMQTSSIYFLHLYIVVSPIYTATPTQGHPFYQARFQIHWYTIWLKSYLSDSHLILFTDITRLEWSEENPITGHVKVTLRYCPMKMTIGQKESYKVRHWLHPVGPKVR